jgi:hypothetical protein
MKKFYVMFLVGLVAITLATPSVLQAQATRNVVLEFVTGTWCQWCPCGDQTAEALLATYPNLVVIAYHGASSDPWQNFNGSSIRSLLGFSAYPTAIIDRRNHPGGSGFPYVDYTMWTGLVSQRYSTAATTCMTLSVQSQSYNTSTRQFDLNVSATALQSLTGQYKISLIITEDSLVYAQTGNATCGYPPSDYVHKWVVRSAVNGATGDNLNSGTWTLNQTLSKTFSTTLDLTWVPRNTKYTILVFKDSTNALYYSEICQAMRGNVTGTTGVTPSPVAIPNEFSLSLNYPNPFNPSTHFMYSVPERATVRLAVFDMLGREIRVLLNNEVREAGSYEVEWDGMNTAGRVMPSGTYFIRLESGAFSQTRKVVLVK